MKTVTFVIRSRRNRWQASFKTLKDAEAYIPRAWEFRTDPTVYIEKVVKTICYTAHEWDIQGRK